MKLNWLNKIGKLLGLVRVLCKLQFYHLVNWEKLLSLLKFTSQKLYALITVKVPCWQNAPKVETTLKPQEKSICFLSLPPQFDNFQSNL